MATKRTPIKSSPSAAPLKPVRPKPKPATKKAAPKRKST